MCGGLTIPPAHVLSRNIRAFDARNDKIVSVRVVSECPHLEKPPIHKPCNHNVVTHKTYRLHLRCHSLQPLHQITEIMHNYGSDFVVHIICYYNLWQIMPHYIGLHDITPQLCQAMSVYQVLQLSYRQNSSIVSHKSRSGYKVILRIY